MCRSRELAPRLRHRHWHGDIRVDDTPLESGLGFACKLKSGVPFLGRDALLAQQAAGLRKRLVCLTLDDPSVPLHGLEVCAM